MVFVVRVANAGRGVWGRVDEESVHSFRLFDRFGLQRGPKPTYNFSLYCDYILNGENTEQLDRRARTCDCIYYLYNHYEKPV